MSTHSNSGVGFLGTGLMGSAMGRRLLSQGIEVLAWDQDASHLQGLHDHSAVLAGSPGEVPSRAAVVITMLPTAEIVRSVVEPLLSSWPPETVWLQMSSVGAGEADELARLAAAHDVVHFDAPVSGSTKPAEEGKLTILASGPEDERRRVEPVLEVLGSRVQWVGEAGAGSRLKLAANHWMIAMVAALAETMHLCELMEVDQNEFLALLDGGPLGPPYGLEKLREMTRHDYPAGFPARLAVKDLELVREVADASGVTLPVLDTMLAQMGAIAEVRGDDDLAVVYELPPYQQRET
ncbi:MAG: NAD(P)-dependent oxidoreductase [Solirubrobacterales bacterium]|nr:NAD(P)-dependent oxidoreductase [Solirubrobacterales bacterium]